MSVPHTYEDSLRVHDAAIFSWLGGITVDYGNIDGTSRDGVPILRVLSAPQRAYADVVDLLVRQDWIKGPTAAAMRENADGFAVLPLPIISIDRTLPQSDPELANVPVYLRKHYLNPETGKWEVHRWPSHYRTEYTVTVWAKKRYTQAYIDEWFRAQFGKRGRGPYETLIPVVHAAPWGTMNQSLKLQDATDLSDLEGDGQRYIRSQYTLSLRTWIMHPVVETLDYVEATETAGEVDDRGDLRHVPEQVWKDAACESENLHIFLAARPELASLIPVTGGAKVARGEVWLNPRYPSTYQVAFTTAGETVELLERPLHKRSTAYGVVSLSFYYSSSVNFVVELDDKQASTLTPGLRQTVAATNVSGSDRRWAAFQVFVPLRAQGVVFRIRAAGGGDVWLNDVEVRNVFPILRTPPHATLGDGSKAWQSLPTSLYLVTGLLATGSASGTVTVQDDVYASEVFDTLSLNPAERRGFTVALTPRTNSIRVLASGVTLETVELQPFNGRVRVPLRDA